MSMLAYLVKMAFKGIQQSDFMKRQKDRAREAEIQNEKSKPVLSKSEIDDILKSNEKK